jgi:hypothetical protein
MVVETVAVSVVVRLLGVKSAVTVSVPTELIVRLPELEIETAPPFVTVYVKAPATLDVGRGEIIPTASPVVFEIDGTHARVGIVFALEL